MKKIIISETQFKRLMLEGDPPPEDEEINPNTHYPISDTELEEFVVTYDRETGETTSGYGWEYKGEQKDRKQRINWWKARNINTQGLRKKIKEFSTHYIDWMGAKIDLAVGPVITSGYRGPKRQINAMYKQWKGNNNYIKKTYRPTYNILGKYIEEFFTTLPEPEAKRKAVNFLREKEKENKYISNHQLRGAIDISLFKDNEKNDEIKKFLEYAKNQGIIKSFLDERDTKSPHFHIQLT